MAGRGEVEYILFGVSCSTTVCPRNGAINALVSQPLDLDTGQEEPRARVQWLLGDGQWM
jgi:hypothetical protein